MPPKLRRLLLALSLFVFAPFVGEFLLGNQPITKIDGVVFLAPLYGGCALLVREFSRRAGRSWVTILLLSAAYGLFLEGVVDQMLFNPRYLGLDSFAGLVAVPVLGTSITIVQASLTLHTIWSIAVPIAIIERFDKTPREPWLGRAGLVITGVITAGFASLLTFYQAQDLHFWAHWWQLVATGMIILGLVVTAFVYKSKPRTVADRIAPKPWIAGGTSFIITSIYWLASLFSPDSAAMQWFDVVLWLVLFVTAIGLGRYWSHAQHWDDDHRFMLAAGALLTYVWAGFVQAQHLEVSHGVAIAGSTVFGLLALLVLSTAYFCKPVAAH